MAIPTKTYAGTLEGNLDGEVIHMDLDLSPEGRAHLISLVTDLYSDQELACIREYSTNARDSHIEAGNDAPIQVTSPTTMNPYLVIRDFGTGMDLDAMRQVFSRYGASSKRGSDDFNGMLGLGGKAALTYTSQFNVTSIKDGMKHQIVVTRDENGVGMMTVVDSSKTAEPNGVEIKIPVKAINQFHRKIKDFFYYWNPGTVLVDGVEPQHILNEPKVSKIGDRNYIKRGSNWGARDIIIMGNVAYKLPERQLSEQVTGNYDSIIIHYADMGAVTFAPSREALIFSPKTQAYLDSVQSDLIKHVHDSIGKELAGAKTHGEAFEIWSRWTNQLGYDKLPKMTYKGEEFKTNAAKNHYKVEIGYGRYNSRTGQSGNRTREGSSVRLADLMEPSNVVVEGYTNLSKPTSAASRKIKLYLDGKNLNVSTVYLFDTLPGKPWTDSVETVDWEDVKAIPDPKRASGGGGGKRGTIPVIIYRSGGSNGWDKQRGVWNDITQLDATKPILYLSPTEIIPNITWIKDIHAVFPDTQIIALGANRFDKFLRENPKAIKFGSYVHPMNNSQFIKDLKASMTEDEKFYVEHDDWYRLVAKNAKDSNDPTFERLTRKVNDATIEVYDRRVAGGNYELRKQKKELSKTYPLLNSSTIQRGPSQPHFTLYINAVVADNEGDKS